MPSLTVLGSTGSIGINTLDVIRQNSHRYEVYALAAGRNVERLAKQIVEFRPKVAVVPSEEGRAQLSRQLADLAGQPGAGRRDNGRGALGERTGAAARARALQLSRRGP